MLLSTCSIESLLKRPDKKNITLYINSTWLISQGLGKDADILFMTWILCRDNMLINVTTLLFTKVVISCATLHQQVAATHHGNINANFSSTWNLSMYVIGSVMQ